MGITYRGQTIYEHHRRAYGIWFNWVYPNTQPCIHFRWQETKSKMPPCLTLTWVSPKFVAGLGQALFVHVELQRALAFVRWHETVVGVHDEICTTFKRADLDYPSMTAPLSDLLEAARMIAAKRGRPEFLLGWIEDNMPEPWSLAASPNPVDVIKALCPVPLSRGYLEGF